MMKFIENTYYHLYNRTNNEEALFRTHDNYLYFLKKYRHYLEDYLETVGYCLMPTHFHFLVRVRDIEVVPHLRSVAQLPVHLQKEDVPPLQGVAHLENHLCSKISAQIKTLLSSYTKAINKRYGRHGSLFQQNTKAKPVPSDRYLITLLTYIHQNPIRSGLSDKAEEWQYSSYQDYIDMRGGTLPSKTMILSMIQKEDLQELTKYLIKEV